MDFQTQSIYQQSSNTSNNQQMTTTYNGNAFDYIKTDKNEEGQYECATCEQPFGDQGEVCWADVGEFNYKDGKPLCGYCCDEMRREDDDEDDCDWFCEGVCGKGFYYNDDHHEEDDEGITNFWWAWLWLRREGRTLLRNRRKWQLSLLKRRGGSVPENGDCEVIPRQRVITPRPSNISGTGKVGDLPFFCCATWNFPHLLKVSPNEEVLITHTPKPHPFID